MDARIISVGAVATAAGVAWWPGVAPRPYEREPVEARVPSWLAPADCVRGEHLAVADAEEVAPAEAAGRVASAMACRRRRPHVLEGVFTTLQVARRALEVDQPDTALLVWALGQDLVDGPLVSQQVGLALQDLALGQLEDQSLSPRLLARAQEVAARRRPLSLGGELAWADTVHETYGSLSLRDQLTVAVWAQQTRELAPAVDHALRTPRDVRRDRLEELLQVEDWRGWGPAALVWSSGRRWWWVRTGGSVLRDAVELDVVLQDRADALVRTVE